MLRTFIRRRASKPQEPALASPTHPRPDSGLRATSVVEILAPHAELIRRIKLCYGTDSDTFDAQLRSLIQRYAGYVHLLPATADSYFSEAGGLLRLGLETGFYSLQGTDAQIFEGGGTISERHRLEPRWRYATFIAGLCEPLHRSLSHVISADDSGNAWPAYLQPLGAWLQAQQVPRYHLRWVLDAPQTRSLGLFALPHIVPAETLHHLAEGNSLVVPHMLAAISGMPVYRSRNIIAALVRRAAALVIERDLRARAERTGQAQRGEHLADCLVDAMRQLVTSNAAWIPNAAKTRVWYARSGLFLVWPAAAMDIAKRLEADQLAGMPSAPETLLDILLAAGVIEPRGGSAPIWTIYPNGEAVEAVKLAAPEIVLCALEHSPPPLPGDLTPPAQAGRAEKPARRDEAARQQRPLPLPGDAAEGATPQPAVAKPTEAAPAEAIPNASATAPPEAPAPDPANTAARQALRLDAPLRLNPAVREALAQIVATLDDGTSAAAACVTASGLFVPLAQLAQRHVDTSVAVRALVEASMLIAPAQGPKTVEHEFGGEKTLGIVIDARFVRGLDRAAGGG